MSSVDPRDLGLAYLATVYSKHKGGIEAAFVEAAKLAANLLLAGVKVYSPIAHTHVIAQFGKIDPYDHGIWLPFDQAMMTAADTLVVANMEGWRDSYGIGEEIKFFEAAGKPIFDLDPPTLLMTRRKTSGVPALEELKSILTRDKPKPAMTVESARARIEELDFRIATAPHWGAALTAMDEERNSLASSVTSPISTSPADEYKLRSIPRTSSSKSPSPSNRRRLSYD